MTDGPNRRHVLAAGGALLAVGPTLVSAQPPLEIGTRPWFERYLAAFNGKDYAGFSAYYATEVRFFGQAATLEGPQAIVDFYRGVHARLDERVDLVTFVGSPTRIMAEIRTTLVAREDWPDFPTGPFVRGDRRQTLNFALYHIENGRFTRVRSARFARLA